MQLINTHYLMEEKARKIGYLVSWSLLEEVYTSPKPGLVDLYSSGAHKDMDYKTFERSTVALEPYFISMSFQGMAMADCPQLLFPSIRSIGIEAEKAMYKATGGVNTHKGIIFHFGILCAATGVCLKKWGRVTLEQLLDIEQKIVRDTLEREITKIQKRDGTSNGEKNLIKYGKLGARGEAISGYDSICRISLPVMIQGVKEGRNWNKNKLQTLLTLMSKVEDSNILARHNLGILKDVWELTGDFLQTGGAYGTNALLSLKKMDRMFIEQNISAGGCADLLALTIFIFKLLKGDLGADD